MKKEQIKKIAFSLFAQKGYEATTIRDIAEKVGIKAPSVYAHYNSKEEIFTDVFNDILFRHIVEVKQLINNGKAQSNKKGLLYDLFVTTLKFFSREEIAAFWGRTIFSPHSFVQEQLNLSTGEIKEELKELYSLIFKEAMGSEKIKEEELNALVTSFFAIVNGYAVFSFLNRVELSDEQIDLAWNIYFNGINK